MKKLPIILFAAVLGFSSAYSQVDGDVYREYTNVPVLDKNDNPITLAWAGGLNNPQLAMADINNDGREDLVVFEEYIGVRTFIGKPGGAFEYNPLYEGNFPEIWGYLKLLDYNRDGVPDLVQRGGAGVGVYKGYYDNNQLKFTYYRDLFYSRSFGSLVNVYVGPPDIPMTGDIDNDGDIDFFSYSQSGSRIVFYRNCQVEDQLPTDSIRVCVKDICWGGTVQYFERQQQLGASCDTNGGTTCKGCNNRSSGKSTHAGNTLCMIDIDGDGDMDYLNGNVSYPDIQLLINGKVDYSYHEDTIVAQDTLWGSNGVDMFMPYMPMAFALDIDGDNDEDLLFSPKAIETENYKSISFYENTGSKTAPNFVYRTNTFLIEDMIDMGTGAYPVLYDVDKDGKVDLLVGSDGYYEYPNGNANSKIAYYKNVSTGEKDYKFKLIDDDFLGLSTKGYKGTAIAIGDIDRDSLDDLVIGRSDGTMAFFKNMASSNTVMPDWQLKDNLMTDFGTGGHIDVGDFATPCIYDVDHDGKNDIVSGNQYGDVIFFKNVSAVPGVAGMKKMTDRLGNIKIFDLYHPYSYSAPYIGKTDDTNEDYLVIGCDWGELYRYKLTPNYTDTFQMVDSSYSYIKVGQRSVPAFANLDNDSKNLHEMIIGNVLGGLSFYKQDFPVSVNSITITDNDIRIYPNPANNRINLDWQQATDEKVYVDLVSMTGQKVAQEVFEIGSRGGAINIGNIPSGMYYCIIKTAKGKTAKPVSVIK